MNNKFNNWVLASRPRTLPAALVPVIVGSAVAVNQGSFYPILSLLALVCAVLIQVGTNFTNDLYDFLKGADTEKRKGPLRVLASGMVSVNEMKIAITIVFGIAFLAGLYLVWQAGIFILIIGILSIAAGLAYTAGPFPLAYNGLGDVFVFLFFGFAGTTGTEYLHTHQVSAVALLASIPVGALVTNILVVNNYRDIEEDRSAGKLTLAVIIGRRLTRVQYIILLLASLLIPLILFYIYDFGYWIFLPYLSLPLVVKLVKMMFTLEGKQLNSTLELTAKFSALYGLLFSAGLII